MSNIAIIGVTGRVGKHLLKEALSRGHTVTAIARKASAAATEKGVTAIDVDILDGNALEKALVGHDAVFSSARFAGIPPATTIHAAKKTGIGRLLVVGGAGSLFATPGLRLIDTPDFPAEYKPEANAGALYLAALQQEKELNWTFLSPSAEFVEGPRTEHFRLGKDDLLIDENGRSWISFADYAIAYLDELETAAHIRQRFTVGYY